MLNKLAIAIASGLGSGLSPKAPGTVGTLAGVLFWILANKTLAYQPIGINLSLVFISIVLGILSTSVILKNSQAKDPQFIVIDEWAGVFISLLFTDINQPYQIIIAFVLFRFFDISKIGPIKKAEKLPGASGVMMDDIIAGLFALCTLSSINFFIPSLTV